MAWLSFYDKCTSRNRRWSAHNYAKHKTAHSSSPRELPSACNIKPRNNCHPIDQRKHICLQIVEICCGPKLKRREASSSNLVQCPDRISLTGPMPNGHLSGDTKIWSKPTLHLVNRLIDHISMSNSSWQNQDWKERYIR